jgi:hypothetical protein
MAHRALRRLLETALGAPGRALLAWRTRGQAERLLAERGLAAPGRALAVRLGHRVQRGPFTGLFYPRRRGDIVHAAKLVGSYECELHGAVAAFVARAPGLVVNIGSGDGYYVAGLARLLPRATVIAVDPDPIAQRACAAIAEANGVGARVSHLVRVDAAGLGALLAAAGPALVVVDCEGYEDDLLDPARAPALAGADLLIETHDFARAGVTARLTDRFAPTHDVRRIEITTRDRSSYVELADLPAVVGGGLLDEFRHYPQSWLACTARASRP